MSNLKRLAFVGLILCVARPHGFAATPPLDAAAFKTLSAADQRDLLLTTLQEREATLQNFEYDAVERSVNQDSKANTETVNRIDSYTMKRNGGKYLLRLRLGDANGKVHTEGSTAWDGQRQKSLTRFMDAPKDMRGTIQDSENNNFGKRAVNQMIGFRFPDAERQPLAEWIKKHSEGEALPELSVIERGAATLVQWKLTEGPRTYTLDFDLSKGFLPTRIEYHYEMVPGRFNHYFLQVDDAKEVDGIWVPSKVRKRNTSAAMPGVATEITCEIPKFSVGKVSDEDVRLTFPVGAEVADTIVGIAFRVLPSGGAEPLPVVDGDTGKVTDASGQPNEAATAAVQKALAPPRAGPLPATATAVATAHINRIWWVVGSAGAILILVGLWTALRPRRLDTMLPDTQK